MASKPPAVTEPPSNDIESQIVSQLEPLLRPDKREQGVRIVTTMVRKFHSGPLPAPEDFQHYDEILPGAADRILRLAEKEQSHRHGQEDKIVSSEYGTRILGQVGALLSLAMLVALVAWCAYIGQPIAAGVIAAIGAIVVAFLKHAGQRVDDPKPEPPKQASKRRKR